MKNILAENLLRFGVKNLNESLVRTLLNEGIKAGDAVATMSPTKVDQTDWTSEMAGMFSNYKALKAPRSVSGDTFFAAAMVAAFNQQWMSNKKFQKQFSTAGSTIFSNNPEYAQQMMQIASSIQYNKQSVNVYPAPTAPTTVATIGRIKDTSQAMVQRVDQSYSSYMGIIAYMNSFNLENVSNYKTYVTAGEQFAPDFTQYDLTQMVDQNNYVNLFQTSIAANSLIFYTQGDKIPNTADKETGTQVVGAQAPQPKAYDVSFETDSANIPTNDPEVAKAVQDAIAMFPDGNISNLTVISSASPEYNSRGGGPRTLADYGQKPVTGTGKPAAGTDNISKNIELAYNRGVSFMNSLNAGLKAQGKPEVTNYTVQWQISDKGGVKVPGRFAQVNWEKAGTPGKEVGTMKSTGTIGDTVSGKATFNIFQHTLNW
jgi:hypothetical protein